jgi:DNA (cytosine-5)-methyltransferase 1
LNARTTNSDGGLPPAKPRLLDLFCGAGGCAVGYARAGFEVVGVDHVKQPRYPFEFVQGDALEYLAAHGPEFDAIHASPPCQGYSQTRFVVSTKGKDYPQLLGKTRSAMEATGLPWVIENVPGAPMGGVELCGTMFGLGVRRHRLFEASFLLVGPAVGCTHRGSDLGVYAGKVTRLGTKAAAYVASSGRTHYRPQLASRPEGAEAMGIGWMNPAELSQAIPPAYTEFVGRQLIDIVRAAR